MEVFARLNVLDFSFSDLTSAKEVETFTEECSDSELLKWESCGRPRYKVGGFLMQIDTFFF